MKIICIFADQLFTFHYDNFVDNEYDRLMELWTDVEYLRNYAIQNNIDDINSFINDLEDNCYVITGGAIKMSQTMQEHPDTEHELTKLNAARAYLKSNNVFDDDSFYEFLIEEL